MRAAIAITTLLVLVLLPVGHAADEAVIRYSAATPNGGVQFLDLLDDGTARGGDVLIRAEDDAWATVPTTATAQMSCDCSSKTFELSMQRSGSGFQTRLPVMHPDLVVGAWSVSITGVTNQGATVTLPRPDQSGATTTPHLLSVAADDSTPPSVTFRNSDNGLIQVGAGESLQIDVIDELLQRVTYKLDDMPAALTLPFPHRIGVDAFDVGEQQITIVATDRAGQMTTKTATVYADSKVPAVMGALPDRFYDGVPNPITLQVEEDSRFTVSARIGSAAVIREFAAGNHSVTVNLIPEGTGTGNLVVEVRDVLGNAYSDVQRVNVTILETDIRLVDVEVGDEQAIPGEPVSITITASQTVSPVPITVDAFYGNLLLGDMTVAATGETEHTFEAILSPGQHSKLMALRTPDEAIELDPDNQAREVAVEVFAGRVIYGDLVFHIRGDALGTPQSAIGPDGARYPLTIEDDGQGIRYGFDVEDQHLYWSPKTPITSVPVERDAPDDRGIPAVSIALLVAAMLALARRRP